MRLLIKATFLAPSDASSLSLISLKAVSFAIFSYFFYLISFSFTILLLSS